MKNEYGKDFIDALLALPETAGNECTCAGLLTGEGHDDDCPQTAARIAYQTVSEGNLQS
jgi:hypothetical protein